MKYVVDVNGDRVTVELDGAQVLIDGERLEVALTPVAGTPVRLVRIGSVDKPVDLQPCGGTHVRSTGEIGRVEVIKLESKGRQNRRIHIVLGE